MRQEPLYLAMQYIPSGTVHDLIHGRRYAGMRTEGGRLPLAVQTLVLVGLFRALEYLASVPVIHRDVKPGNILAVVEDSQLLKV